MNNRMEAAECMRVLEEEGYGVNPSSLAYALGLEYMDDAGDLEIWDRLSDLIDPTCIPKRKGTLYVCSECGHTVGSTIAGGQDLYCSTCGRRVRW